MLEIASKEICQRLQTDNPWWETSDDIRWENDPKRVYFDPFYELVVKTEVVRAVVLMGPRRVGKTVIAYQSIAKLIEKGVRPKNILYIPLDSPLYSGLTLEKILLTFLKLNKIPRNETAYLFFDEIQYLRDWEVHLKSLVDSYPQHRFIATGSAAAALKLKSRESGAGRFTDFILPPLTFHEYIKLINKEEIFDKDARFFVETETGRTRENIIVINEHFMDYINFGGYPEAVFSEEIRKAPGRFIKNDIIDKVLTRDLPSLYGISDISELNRLFITIARNTGQEVNLSGFSQKSNVAKGTISKYLEYLESAFLIKRVRRVDRNSKKFQREHKFKIYLTNPSMYSALFGAVGKDNNAVMEKLVETSVFSQMFHLARNENLYYARWNKGEREVDLIIMDETRMKAETAIEIKWSDRAIENLTEVKGLLDFKQKHDSIFTLCLTKEKPDVKPYKNGRVFFYPTSLFCFKMGNALNSEKFRESFIKSVTGK